MGKNNNLILSVDTGEEFKAVAQIEMSDNPIIIHDVLVEIDEKNMTFTNPVFILKHFQNEFPLGMAYLKYKEDGIYADLHLNEQLPDQILWPAIGYKVIIGEPECTGHILTIGLCTNPNVDPRIKCVPNS